MHSRLETIPDASLPVEGADPACDADQVTMLLVLINQCVDAMNIMQQRMSALEDHARRTSDNVARDKVEARADFATMRTRVKLAESGVDQLAIRIAACEATAVDITTAQARDYQIARAEAESWRKRAQDDLARLAEFDGRLASVESGLQRRLEQTEATLVATEAQAVALQGRAETSEASATASEKKLADTHLAMADQRARIACLQAKLALAADTRRFSGSLASEDEKAVAGADGDIIDLAAVLPDGRRHSAA